MASSPQLLPIFVGVPLADASLPTFQNPPQFLLLGALCLCCSGTASVSVGAELVLRSFLTKSDVPRADS